MGHTVQAKLLLGLGCCLLAASRLLGQVNASVPEDSSRTTAPTIGDNRFPGVQQPRVRLENPPPVVRSPADEVRDFTRGGTMPPPQIGAYPEPLPFDPKDIHFPPPPKIQFTPPADQSREIGAIFSIVVPVGILLATIMMGLSRRRQEQAAHGPETHASGPRGRSFVKLGADGKGGIMYQGEE